MGPRDLGRHRGGLGPIAACCLAYLLALALAALGAARLAGQTGRTAAYRLTETVEMGPLLPDGSELVLLRRGCGVLATQGRTVEAAVYRVDGEAWPSMLGVHILDGTPPDTSSLGGLALSTSAAEALWGGGGLGQRVILDEAERTVEALYRMPQGLAAWWTGEEAGAYLCEAVSSGSGELLAVVRFAPGTQATADYRLRELLGNQIGGYAPLYQWEDWTAFFWRLLLWLGLALGVWSLWPLGGWALRRWVIRPMAAGWRQYYLGRFLLRHGWRLLAAGLTLALAVAGLAALARGTFPVLPLPAEVLPGNLLHLDTLWENLLTLRRYRLSHPTPVLPLALWAQGELWGCGGMLALGLGCLVGAARRIAPLRRRLYSQDAGLQRKP